MSSPVARGTTAAALLAALVTFGVQPIAAQAGARPAAPASSAAPGASASVMAPAALKELMLQDYTRLRTTVLEYVDAMPDSALRFRPTPGVRSFSEQIDHIVGTNVAMAAGALKGGARPPQMGDSARYLNDKAALRAYVAASYDYAITALRAATPAQLAASASVFGLPAQPAFRWLQLGHEHSAWTLGQTIPYLRLNKVTPPEYKMPF